MDTLKCFKMFVCLFIIFFLTSFQHLWIYSWQEPVAPRTGRSTHGSLHAQDVPRRGRSTLGSFYTRVAPHTSRSTQRSLHARGRSTLKSLHAQVAPRTSRSTHKSLHAQVAPRTSRWLLHARVAGCSTHGSLVAPRTGRSTRGSFHARVAPRAILKCSKALNVFFLTIRVKNYIKMYI